MKTGPAGEDGYSPTADAAGVRRLFGHIAGVYDLLNRVLSFGLDSWWRRKLALAVPPFLPQSRGRLLDLAAGTFEVSLALARRYPEAQITALDFCRPMLLKGLPKLKGLPPGRICPLQGDARALPLADDCVDAVTMAFGLRNIRPRQEAYSEALRVLAPGGRLCVLEFAGSGERILFGLYNLYLKYLLPAVGRLLSRDKGAYRYLAETIAAYPAPAALEREMREAGFVAVSHTRHTFGIVCLHVGEKSAADSAVIKE